MPHIDTAKSQASIQTWKTLKPLTIEEIIKNTDEPIDLDKSIVEFKEVKFEDHTAIGLFQRGTDTIQGVARRVFAHTQI